MNKNLLNDDMLYKCTALIERGYNADYIKELYEIDDVDQVNEHITIELTFIGAI